jgi:hypothetical protein
VLDALREFLKHAASIAAESADRLAAGNHEEQEIDAGLVMMLFEAPPASAGLPDGAPTTKNRLRASGRGPR